MKGKKTREVKPVYEPGKAYTYYIDISKEYFESMRGESPYYKHYDIDIGVSIDGEQKVFTFDEFAEKLGF